MKKKICRDKGKNQQKGCGVARKNEIFREAP